MNFSNASCKSENVKWISKKHTGYFKSRWNKFQTDKIDFYLIFHLPMMKFFAFETFNKKCVKLKREKMTTKANKDEHIRHTVCAICRNTMFWKQDNFWLVCTFCTTTHYLWDMLSTASSNDFEEKTARRLNIKAVGGCYCYTVYN